MTIKEYLRERIQERFIYSWVISLILGALLVCISFFILVWSIESLKEFNGQRVTFLAGIQVTFWLLLSTAAFGGMLTFSIGTLLGQSTNQMLLCEWRLWPKPKKLRITDVFFDSFKDLF